MLPACASADKAYSIGQVSVASQYSVSGESPSEACRSMAVAQSASFISSTEYQCVTSASSLVYPVIKVCEPMFDGAPYDYAAGGALFGFAFAGVMGLYLASHAIGLVVKAVRDM